MKRRKSRVVVFTKRQRVDLQHVASGDKLAFRLASPLRSRTAAPTRARAYASAWVPRPRVARTHGRVDAPCPDGRCDPSLSTPQSSAPTRPRDAGASFASE